MTGTSSKLLFNKSMVSDKMRGNERAFHHALFREVPYKGFSETRLTVNYSKLKKCHTFKIFKLMKNFLNASF